MVIIAQDEERTIGDVLEAIKDLAAEIVLVDSGSTDRTPEIALAHGARLIHQEWLGYAAQKNFALAQACCEWVLSLDADEIVTDELKAEIRQVLEGSNRTGPDGYRIPRLLFIGEQPLWHGGFYPDAQLRLFRRGAGRFNDRLVHESVKLACGRTADLKNHLLHRAYTDIAEFRLALDKYAGLAAAESLRSGFGAFRCSVLNLLFYPSWTFFYRFAIRAGFLDGIIGLKANLAYANYVRKKLLYLRNAVSDSRTQPTP